MTISGMKRNTLPQRVGHRHHFLCGLSPPARRDQLRGVVYYRFPLSLRMVEELLAARGIELTYETVRRRAVKFGLGIAWRIRSTALARVQVHSLRQSRRMLPGAP